MQSSDVPIGHDHVSVNHADSKGYLVDEDGFDFMKISFLREIKIQQRSLRFVFFMTIT